MSSPFYTLHDWSNTDGRWVVFTNPGTYKLEAAATRPGCSLTIKSQSLTILSAPTQLSPTNSVSGGTLASGTYYYVITAINANGESLASNEESIAVVGPTASVNLSWNAVSGATSYRVYRGTSAGGENVYYALGNVTTYTDTNAATTGSGTPPAATNVTISTTGSDLIDGASSLTLATQYDTVTLFSDGKNWNIVARTAASNAP